MRFFIITIFFLIFSCSDKIKFYFKSYQEVLNSGVIDRGWIPKYFPTNTYDIVLVQDIDLNKVWVKSSFYDKILISNIENKILTDSNKIINIMKLFNLTKAKRMYYQINEKEYIIIDEEKKIFFYYRDKY